MMSPPPTYRLRTLVAAVGLLVAACGTDDDRSGSGNTDDGPADQTTNWVCGDRLPDLPPSDEPIDIVLRDSKVASVEIPVADETTDQAQFVEAKGLEVEIDVTNTSEGTVFVEDRFPVSRLADPETLIIVSASYPQRLPGDLEIPPPVEIPPGETRTIRDVVVGIDAYTSCDSSDLPAGNYVLMMSVDLQDHDDEVPRSVDWIFDVQITSV